MNETILAIDLGTTSVKTAIIDRDGQVLSSATREYQLSTPKQNWIECSAETYWNAFEHGLKQIIDEKPDYARNIVAIGISAQGETLFVLDDNMAPLRNAIVWMDNRSVKEADTLRARFGDEICYHTTGQVRFDPCWPAAKILWLRENEPDLFRKISKFLLIEDWFIYRLTGKLVSEGSLLCSTCYWDIIKKDWWLEMLDFLDITTRQLPEIREPGEAIATLKPEVAKELGLFENVIVCTGALDQAAGAIGVGNIHQGIFSENIGAALAICAPVDKPIFDPNRAIPIHYFGIPDMYMLHTFTTGGMAIRWYRDQFCLSEMNVESSGGGNAYALMDAAAAKVPVGSNGLIVLPHLGGSMAPDINPKARGVFFGFTLKHTRAHFARAIMESIGYIIRRNIDALSNIGLDVNEIRSLGGGSKSPLWNQIKADITGIPLVLMNSPEAACLGAAILAGKAIELFESIDGACCNMIVPKMRFEPNAKNQDVYADGYKSYQQIFQNLASSFEATFERS